MLVLGICGGVDPVYTNYYNLPYYIFHDAAAVLIEDGEVVAAIEEERLNRIKHTNKSAATAVQFCLSMYNVNLSDVDAVAFYVTEEHYTKVFNNYYLYKPYIKKRFDSRTLIHQMLGIEKGELDAQKIHFVNHHLAHAASTFYHSGFDESLVFTVDGEGEELAGVVFSGSQGKLEKLRSFTEKQSLGYLYLNVIRFLGYDIFDEYKVMGLAPYGNPTTYREFFQNRLYTLLADGDYCIYLERIPELHHILESRLKGSPFTQSHKDLAATLQESLENIVMHILTHYQKTTGHTKLCMAGGVAHNCSMNGKILYSNLFKEVFVHPSAHDAGCALGSALEVYNTLASGCQPKPLKHVYWGKHIGDKDSIYKTLEMWKPLIQFEKVNNICETVAGLLAMGEVIGWVQGRSEFGPRALGNRSILADPRPIANKEHINKIVKKREGYRPFAPSIIEERVEDFFVVSPNQKRSPYMAFAIEVRPDKRSLLGAITHIDGTARIQTVARDTNEIFWCLLNEFGKITGLPMLLNTSFNNNVEPIVDSLEDALVCYLTTDLNYLVAGDYLIVARERSEINYLDMVISLPVYIALRQEERWISATKHQAFHEIYCNYNNGKVVELSRQVYELLKKADGFKSLSELFEEVLETEQFLEEAISEIIELWSQRLIRLRPKVALENM